MPTAENRPIDQRKSDRKVLYLKAALTLVLSIITGYAVYLAIFTPSVTVLCPISINTLPAGEWKLQEPFESFISGPIQSKMMITKDSTGKSYIHFKTANSEGTFSGIIFYVNKHVPRNSGLVMHWRSTGYAPLILIDIMDGSGGSENPRNLGENFYIEYPVPGSKWSAVKFSLDTLKLNSYQLAGKVFDGKFDYNLVRRISFTFYPNSDLTLDLSDIHFTWETEKWSIISVLTLVVLTGLLLLFRTRSKIINLNGNLSLRTNALISRIIYSIAGLSAVCAAIFQGPDFLSLPILSTYGLLLVLIIIEEFTLIFQHSSVWSLRYAAVLFTSYALGLDAGILPVSLLLIAAYLPLILEKNRVIFWAVALLALIGYIAKPYTDNHFTFVTGLIFIVCSSTVAIIIRELLLQNHADFLAQMAILQYEALFKSTSDAIYILDSNGVIETVNHGFERLTGYSQNELKGHKITDFVCPESKGTIEEMFIKIDENDPIQFDIHFANKNGEVRTALVRGNPIYKDNEITGFQALATDITERKISEEKLRQSTEEIKQSKALLEKKATELLRLNDMLKLSEERLKELNASKDKFFSIISHDLRNPFHSLVGLSDLIANDYEKLSPDEIRLFSAHIKGSVKNLYKLLENLLQWASIQSGKMVYKASQIDLFDLVETVVEVIKTNAIRKSISLNNNVRRDITVFADYNSIHSVIQNLITNAIKFTNPGGQVSVSSVRRGKMVEIIVADTGIGMNDEDLQKLFRIDVHHSTQGTASEIGTGLGLILCKEMIENNGGVIHAESEPGEGSRFIFTLPEFIPLFAEQPTGQIDLFSSTKEVEQ